MDMNKQKKVLKTGYMTTKKDSLIIRKEVINFTGKEIKK